MALSLQKTLDNGVPISYFRINKIFIIRGDGADSITICVDAYVNQTVRQSVGLPVETISYVVDSKAINTLESDAIIAAAYNYIKTLDDFIGSIDV